MAVRQFERRQARRGLNGRRPRLLKLLADPFAQAIMIEHRDRLMRFGCEYVEVK
jgi:putative resolvase